MTIIGKRVTELANGDTTIRYVSHGSVITWHDGINFRKILDESHHFEVETHDEFEIMGEWV